MHPKRFSAVWIFKRAYDYNRNESYDWLRQIYDDRRKEALAELEFEA